MSESDPHRSPIGVRALEPFLISLAQGSNGDQIKHNLAKRQSYALNHTTRLNNEGALSMRGIARQKLGYFPCHRKKQSGFGDSCRSVKTVTPLACSIPAPAEGRRWQRLPPAPRR
jgi:hypothetical protein